MPAMHEGIIRKNPFLELKFKSKKVYKGYLTNEELTCIIKADLKSVSLERVRDQFLFCCYTGLAYVDLGQLGKANIRKDNGGSYFIEKPRQKTGQLSIVPLIIPAIEILKKYSNSNDFRDFSWYVSTNQKINEQLKTIGRVSKVEKLLHFHLARHTFATTITLSNGVPIESVSSMLGHATIRQTQDYAKVVALKLTNDMKRVDLVYS
jgi:site-specific recombinase XerD